MATQSDNEAKLANPQRSITARVALPALIVFPIIILWVLAATEDESNIALTRNEVVTELTGERVWQGTMTNVTDSQYRDIAVVIQFVDLQDTPVGEVRGQARRLEPGEALELAALLPAGAVAIKVQALEWRTGRRDKQAQLGPYAAWPFGQLQTD